MSFIQSITNLLSKKQPEAKNIRRKLQERQINRTKSDVATWQRALKSAENVESPDRTKLYEIYLQARTDSHLTSVIQSRKNKTLSKPFQLVDKSEKEDKEKTKLFEASWFYVWMSLALDSRFEGHSLIGLTELVEDKFVNLELVPRQYVRPEFSLVVENPSDTTGNNYLDPGYYEWYVPVGGKRDLGILQNAAPLTIWKRNALAAYADYSEMFGMPFRVLKTAVSDEDQLRIVETSLAQMGSSGYATIGIEDEIEFIHANGSSNKPVFDHFIRLLDEQISKLILGGTMTSDNGSSRSQAEVHQDQADEYAMDDLRFIEFAVNDELIPRMVALGFPLKDFKFKFDFSEKLSKLEQFSMVEKLLPYYEIPEKYILDQFGVEVVKKAEPAPQPNKPTEGGKAVNFTKPSPKGA